MGNKSTRHYDDIPGVWWIIRLDKHDRILSAYTFATRKLARRCMKERLLDCEHTDKNAKYVLAQGLCCRVDLV